MVGRVLLLLLDMGRTEEGRDRLLLLPLPMGITVEAAGDCDEGCLKGASNDTGLDDNDDDDTGTAAVDGEAAIADWYFSCR